MGHSTLVGRRARSGRVIVIGAGMGGLAAAAQLASDGFEVTVLERAGRVGGKLRTVEVAGRPIDSGPTVFTMREAFEGLFEHAGARFEDYVPTHEVEVLARHGWLDGTRLDLYVDVERSAAHIAEVFGADAADGYRRFVDYARGIYQEVSGPFIHSDKPSLGAMAGTVASRGLRAVMKIDWHRSMWRALGTFFPEPHLRQLFGRYATYYGSDPFFAPATLNLIAWVEQKGVWTVDGGMYRLAEGIARLATEQGAEIRTGVHVREIEVKGRRARAVVTAAGERLEADAVVVNADPAALASGCLGDGVRVAGRPMSPKKRSLSAITWSTVASVAPDSTFDLDHHNVFFSSDYREEFRALSQARTMPEQPTVYVCAQDRRAEHVAAGALPGSGTPERLLVLINSPADGDQTNRSVHSTEALETCRERTFKLMERCGLKLDVAEARATTPTIFEEMFPATGGALYGAATHGSMAPFSRPTARTKVAGLYLVGGGAHPGAGVPMVTLGGRIAANFVTRDLASTSG